jgi:hypothetical protein
MRPDGTVIGYEMEIKGEKELELDTSGKILRTGRDEILEVASIAKMSGDVPSPATEQ